MKIFKNNLGMYAEAVIDRTCDYYRQKELAIIEKRQIPIKIIRRIDETTIVGKLQAKSFVDYFGVINGHYFEFEVKETDADCFNVNLIKKHQFEYLQYLIKLNIKCFIIVYFSKQSAFYLLDFN
jgi:recombination protein U